MLSSGLFFDVVRDEEHDAREDQRARERPDLRAERAVDDGHDDADDGEDDADEAEHPHDHDLLVVVGGTDAEDAAQDAPDTREDYYDGDDAEYACGIGLGDAAAGDEARVTGDHAGAGYAQEAHDQREGTSDELDDGQYE